MPETPDPTLDQITEAILDEAFALHRRLGPGLLESVYEALLSRALTRRGFSVDRQRPIPMTIDGIRFEVLFRADLIVQDKVLVELKAIETLARVHTRQLNTYLQFTGLPIGLLINFGSLLLRDGLKRVVNQLDPALSPALYVNRSKIDRWAGGAPAVERAAPPRSSRDGSER